MADIARNPIFTDEAAARAIGEEAETSLACSYVHLVYFWTSGREPDATRPPVIKTSPKLFLDSIICSVLPTNATVKNVVPLSCTDS